MPRTVAAALSFAVTCGACSFFASYEDIAPPADAASDVVPTPDAALDADADAAAPPTDASLRDMVGQPLDDAAAELLRSCSAPDLFAYFSFEDASGGTVASCGSAQLYGTLSPTTGTITSGHGGSVFSSDGSRSIKLHPQDGVDPYVNMTEEMTIVAWLRTRDENWGDGFAAVVDKSGAKAQNELGWGLRLANGSAVAFAVANESRDQAITIMSSPGAIEAKTPSWIGARFWRGQVWLFANGTPVAGDIVPHTRLFAAPYKEAMVGKRPLTDETVDYPFVGDIDDVRIFSRALTDYEIAALSRD